MSDKLPEFDFELWSRLAEESPEQFESMCENTIQDIIQQAKPDHQQRLKGLQWQLDQISRTSATPLSACIKMSKLMWEHVTEEDGLQDQVKQLTSGTPLEKSAPKEADVIPFRSRRE